MGSFKEEYKTVEFIRGITKNREPDFNNFLKVLNREIPSRPTLYEFFLNDDIYSDLTGEEKPAYGNLFEYSLWEMKAFRNAGYDYYTLGMPNEMHFPHNEHENKKSTSLNEGAMIFDRESFENYEWPDTKNGDYSYFKEISEAMITGMKGVVKSPSGVLENVTSIIGFDNMCFMKFDDPKLLQDIINKVGETLLNIYKNTVYLDGVGAAIVNDDWGFNTQTVLSTEDMKKYVIPWHKKIVEEIHKSGKPAFIHSCGQLKEVMDDIIDNIKFQGKHSFEDKILPVEEAYDLWGDRIAILGGMDMDFVCRETPENIFKRASNMLNKTRNKGGYALGTGNSVPKYLPKENYYSMISAALV